VIENLPDNSEALSSNPSTAKQRKKKTNETPENRTFKFPRPGAAAGDNVGVSIHRWPSKTSCRLKIFFKNCVWHREYS
jgi:hypothetical protein